MLDRIAPRDHNAINIRPSLHNQSVTNDLPTRPCRLNQHPLIAPQQKRRLSDHLRIEIHLHLASALRLLNPGFVATVQSQPEAIELDFFVELHDVGGLGGVGIRVTGEV